MGSWIRGPLRAWLTLHRPVKVERTRKRSEGFPPDRKVEKKKGEGLLSTGCSALAAAWGLWEGRGVALEEQVAPVSGDSSQARRCLLSYLQSPPWRRSYRNYTARSSSP